MVKPPPIPGSIGRKIPPPVPSTIPQKVRPRIAGIVQKFTVKALASSLNIGELTETVEYLKIEMRGETFTRPQFGSLIYHNGKREAIVISDLHGNVARMDSILKEYGAKLSAGEVDLVFLGDLLHPETAGNAADMTSSIALLNTVVKLKHLYKDQVHLLLGNHDLVYSQEKFLTDTIENVFGAHTPNLASYFIEKGYSDQDFVGGMGIGKKGVAQALVFIDALCSLLKDRGYDRSAVKSIAQRYQEFFDNSPLAMILKRKEGDIYLAHSGIVDGGVTREQLIQARSDKRLMQGMLWNKHSKNPKKPAEKVRDTFYVEDVDATMAKLGVSDIIVGHEADPDARSWKWQPYRRKFYVVHTNLAGSFGWVSIKSGKIDFYEELFVSPQVAAQY